METVILVSVFCTLGVVTLLGAIVVAFMKLNRKVDVELRVTNDAVSHLYDRYHSVKNDILKDIQLEIKDLYNTLDKRDRDNDDRFRELYNEFNHNNDEVKRKFEECYSFVDSRCDKLDNKICGKNCKCKSTEKQLLTD